MWGVRVSVSGSGCGTAQMLELSLSQPQNNEIHTAHVGG